MRCVPEQKKKVLLDIVIVILVALCACAFVLSLQWDGGRILCLLAAWVSLFAVLFVVARYRLASFIYVVRPRGAEDTTGLAASYLSIRDVPFYMLDLAVFKVYPWRAPVVQCVLSLGDLKEAVLVGNDRGAVRDMREKYKAENGGRFVVYDYTLTPGTDEVIMLIFADGERYIGVLMEADEQMRGFFEAVG